MLDEYNVLTQSFRRVRDALQLPENENLRLRISGSRVENDRRYELPTGNKSTGLTRITSLNPLFDSLHFPLLFPYGNDGYHEMIRYNPLYVDPKRKRGFVSQNEYYNFRLQYRRVEGKTLIRSGKALQHFCIDAFTTIEQNRLIYLRLNQKNYVQRDLNSQNLGNIILPATFTGGVRYMMQLYQDAISICQFHGNPDLFITSEDKPMLVARVFKMRLSLLREDLKKKQYFGRYVAAELPDPELDPVGYVAVTKFMIHGPCGHDHPSSPCMKEGHCSKFFPKSYATETTFDDNGYVTYRRRQTDITAVKAGTILDNRYVVPYHRELLIKYQAHMNVEVCHKGQLIKYLFKYILKGPDRSNVFNGILNRPDIGKTMLTEWFTLNRTCPSARKYTYSEITHAFTWDKQASYWVPRKKGFAIGRVRSIPPRGGDVFYLRMLLCKIPGALSFEHLRTVNGILCKDYQTACQALGLLSNDDEWHSVMAEVTRWAMPPLIRSTFVALLVFCEVTSPTTLFASWWMSMADDFKRRIQRLSNNPVSEPPPELLRDEVLQNLQGLLQNYSSSLSHFGLPLPTIWDTHLQTDDLISQQLQYDASHEDNLYNSYRVSLNSCQQLAHDAVLGALASTTGKLFFLYGHGGTGKTYLYNCLLSKVRSQGQIALVVASSGIAATLLPGGVTAHSRFKIPLEVDATSTCAIKKGTSLARLMESASLIVWDEAPMVHRLSFEAVDRTLCDIMNMPTEGPCYKPFGGKTVILGGDFRQTLPIVPNGGREDNLNASFTRSYLWNHCTLLELRTNMRVNSSSINMLPISEGLNFPEWVLAVGDGKICPIAHINHSTMDWISIPEQFLIPKSINPIIDLVARVYPDLARNHQSVAYIRTRAIVTPTNQVVSSINDYVLTQIPGDEKIYLSSDTLTTPGPNQTRLEAEYPVEFLNALTFNGMPEHQLRLKPYAIVMLLRNLNPSAGLCNGTRILLTHLGEHTLRGLIIGGSFEGTIAIIPRIVLDKTDPNWPFTLKRRQYPVRLCYAVTINKSQGKTLEHIGIYLPNPVFSHGQLYVALSRARSVEGVHISIQNDANIPETSTRNIVYKEIFEDLQDSTHVP
ncbi:ATP-dependent DNA helicase PIF1 [Linum perenne]